MNSKLTFLNQAIFQLRKYLQGGDIPEPEMLYLVLHAAEDAAKVRFQTQEAESK